MATETPLVNICPYCKISIESLSKDHIFPQFLGGIKKINSCKNCNNVFGYSFEAETAKILRQMQILISSWGINLKMPSPVWKNVPSSDGKTYNLSVGNHGIKLELSKPLIEYDEEGEIKSGIFGTQKLAEQVAKNLLDKKKADEIEIEFNQFSKNILQDIEHTLVLGPDIKRTALKMCMSLSTLLPNFTLEEIDDGRKFLNVEEELNSVDNTFAAYENYPEIDSLRNPLSHIIYVERGENYVSGLVQFFGVIQLYCHLGELKNISDHSAVFASLDPLTGEEKFSIISSLNIEEPQTLYTEENLSVYINSWLKKYRTEALKRGATNPPDLSISSIHIDRSA